MNDITITPEQFLDSLCSAEESLLFESKRVSGKMVKKALETIVAFANTEGGLLALGVEDYGKAQGKNRLIGIGENPEAVDELKQKVHHQITLALNDITWTTAPCTVKSGAAGELVLIFVPKSSKVHSIAEDGTWKRLPKGNREMTAREINELCFSRGVNKR